MIHELKCINPYFTDIVEGRKTFELRKNDRDYKSGDKLHLRLYNPETKGYEHGREFVVDVVGLHKNLEQFGLPGDMCIMSIATINRVVDLSATEFPAQDANEIDADPSLDEDEFDDEGHF